jgi:hypothetical protein
MSMTKFDHKSKSNLGQPGYKAILVNLPASLKQYEGAMTTAVEVITAPDRRGSGVFNIQAIQEFEDTPAIHLNLRGKYLEPIIDRSSAGTNSSKLELAKLSKSGYYKDCVLKGDSGAQLSPGDSANNRSSVKIAHRKYIQQFKRAMGMKKKEVVRQLLVEMDDDSNGSIGEPERNQRAARAARVRLQVV